MGSTGRTRPASTDILFGTTAGDWRLPEGVEHFDSDNISISILDADGFPIAEVEFEPILDGWEKRFPGMRHWSEGSNDGRTVRRRPREEVLANAHVMRSAPRLRAACLAALSLAEKTPGIEAALVARELAFALKTARG